MLKIMWVYRSMITLERLGFGSIIAITLLSSLAPRFPDLLMLGNNGTGHLLPQIKYSVITVKIVILFHP
jgi:hypothetical protein